MKVKMMSNIERWHIAKQITIGNLITGLFALSAIGLWVLDLQNRVTVVEYKAEQNTLTTLVIRQEIADGTSEVLSAIGEVGDRQYRHIEDHAKSDSFAGN